MYEAGDALLDACKRAVLVKLDDHTLNLVALIVFAGGGLPRIVFERLDREAYLAVFDVDYFYLHFVADFKEVARIVDKAPIDFRYVHQALEPFLELKEGAEINHAGNLAVNNVAHGVVGDELFLFLIIRAFFGEDEFALLWLGADHRDGEFGADELAELLKNFIFVAVGDARVVLGLKLGGGEEAGEPLPVLNG